MAAPGVAPLHHSDISEAATFQHPPALQQVPREGMRLVLSCPKEHPPNWVFPLDHFNLSPHIPRGKSSHVEVVALQHEPRALFSLMQTQLMFS